MYSERSCANPAILSQVFLCYSCFCRWKPEFLLKQHTIAPFKILNLFSVCVHSKKLIELQHLQSKMTSLWADLINRTLTKETEKYVLNRDFKHYRKKVLYVSSIDIKNSGPLFYLASNAWYLTCGRLSARKLLRYIPAQRNETWLSSVHKEHRPWI